MAYVEDSDVEERVGGEAPLIQLTDDDGLGGVDYAVLDDEIAKAVGQVETYLAGAVEVPVTDTDQLARIKGPLLDLINMRLKSRRDVVNASDTQLYQDALAFFQKIGGQAAVLDGSTGASGPRLGSETPLVFTRTTLRGF